MKVGCEQCGASYSVADEKVAGRRLKLRCKKCGEPMVIDGTEPGSAQDAEPIGPRVQVVNASAEPAPASEEEWYVGIDDSAQGPYTLAEVAQYYASGGIGPQTLVYREGLESWTPASDLPELHSAAAARRSLPPVPPRTSTAAVSSARAALDRPITLGRDPFAESAEPSPDVSAADMLGVGLHRDGTVRFSLDDIRALSASSMPSLMPAAPSRPGYASGGGSGLIDVRSLTEAEGGHEAYRPISGIQVSPLDTMAPLSLPAAGGQAGVDLRTKVLAGLASFGFLLASGVAMFAITRPAQQPVASLPPPAAAAAATVATVPLASVAMAAPSAPAPVAAPAAPALVARANPMPSAPAVAPDERSAKPRKRETRKVTASARPSSPPARESAKSAPDIDDILAKSPSPEKGATKGGSESSKSGGESSKGGGDSIDDLLLGALDGKKAAPKSAPAPEAGAELPQIPNRDQMMSALGKAKVKVAKCKGSGVATTNITLAGSGRVASVAVSGVDGPAKSCVESSVRSTPFPKFQKDTFAVKAAFKVGGK